MTQEVLLLAEIAINGVAVDQDPETGKIILNLIVMIKYIKIFLLNRRGERSRRRSRSKSLSRSPRRRRSSRDRKEREQERERRKKGLPDIKKDHLSGMLGKDGKLI